MQPIDRLVGHRLREVERLPVLSLLNADELLVLGDHRVELTGLRSQETPVVIEPPARSASGRTDRPGPAPSPASNATYRPPPSNTRSPSGPSGTAPRPSATSPNSPESRPRTPGCPPSPPRDGYVPSAAPPSSASTSPSRGNGCTATPPRRSDRSSGYRSDRRTCPGSQSPASSISTTNTFGAPSGGFTCPICSQPGSEPPSV